ncbi:MAG: amidohydrolase family protein [Candidatus Neomarinimicrobiota bacterium]
MKGLLILLIFLVALPGSDQIPAPDQTRPILLYNGVIHTVSAGTIENGAILFENGKITRIAEKIAAPADAESIDLMGKHVYPGFISAVTSLGLVEISAVKATADFAETGSINPNLRANVGYNPDSEIIPVTRSNGVLLANVTPSSGLLSGQSSLMMLDGWTWESATLEHSTGLHLNWPSMSLNYAFDSKIPVEKQTEKRSKKLTEIDELFDMARSYGLLKKANPETRLNFPGVDLRLEAIVPFAEGKKPIFIHAQEKRQIEAALFWSVRQKVKIIIVGGRDAWRVTALLKKYKIPVIFESVLSLPQRRFEDYDQIYKIPALLDRDGVTFCITTSGSAFETAHLRNLPYHAAMAAAFGLSKETALRSITLSTAEILGVADRVGSLDEGKDATLFVSTGDALETSSQVRLAFIQGRKIDLSDRHKILYKKYQEKYRQLKLID